MNKLRSIIAIIFSNSYYVYACKTSSKRYNEGQIIRHNLNFGDLYEISMDANTEIETINEMDDAIATACEILNN